MTSFSNNPVYLSTSEMKSRSKKKNSKLGSKTILCLLTDEEIDKLFNACETYEEKLICNTMIYTGMRISEFIHLRKEWILWQGNGKGKGYIIIPTQMECHCAECERDLKHKGIWTPKTSESSRRIPIVPEVEKTLTDYFKNYDMIIETIPYRESGWDMVTTVAKRAGIQHKVFPHSLRGTFASILAGKDFDGFAIKQIMGWSSIQTADKYIKVSPQRLAKKFEDKW